jgi:hypothetical protein
MKFVVTASATALDSTSTPTYQQPSSKNHLLVEDWRDYYQLIYLTDTQHNHNLPPYLLRSNLSVIPESHQEPLPSPTEWLNCEPLLMRYHIATQFCRVHHCSLQNNKEIKKIVTLRVVAYRQSVHLGVKPVKAHDQWFLFQLSPCGHSPYITSSLTTWCVRLVWACFTFVTCTYRTYNMLLKIRPCTVRTNALPVRALQSTPCL